jgi:2-polyprenyl-6-methoxyphenol hydroxylase-like FAD-dependent oxidoreductase
MRADLLRALADELPAASLSLGREVAGVTAVPGGGGGGAQLRFADGGVSETFDLIIGADGIKSKVREAMFGTYDAKYSGIRIVFGCTGEGDAAAAAEARPASEHGETHQWFGDGCYTLVFTGGGEGRKQHNIAVCIADAAVTEENAAWSQKQGRRAGSGGPRNPKRLAQALSPKP